VRGDIPHGVPGEVLVAVVEDLRIELDPRWVDAELEAGAAVVIGVEEQPHHVGGREVVAAGEDGDDAVGVRIEAADKDVEVAGVEGDFRFGGQLGRAALAGTPLLEFRNRRRLTPDGIVITSVDGDRLRGARRGDAP